MSRVLPFVDAERLVVMHFNAVLAQPYRAMTEIPNPLDSRLPLAVVMGAAGSQDSDVTAYPRVDVYNMAATRAAMWALTRATTEAVRSLAGAEVDGQLVDTTVTMMRPYALAWSPTVYRSIGTYEIQLRPRSA